MLSGRAPTQPINQPIELEDLGISAFWLVRKRRVLRLVYVLRPTLFETGILILGETARFAKGAHLAVGMDGGFGLEMELGFRAQLAGGV